MRLPEDMRKGGMRSAVKGLPSGPSLYPDANVVFADAMKKTFRATYGIILTHVVKKGQPGSATFWCHPRNYEIVKSQRRLRRSASHNVKGVDLI